MQSLRQYDDVVHFVHQQPTVTVIIPDLPNTYKDFFIQKPPVHITSALSLNSKIATLIILSRSYGCPLMLDYTSYHLTGLELHLCPINHDKYVAVITHGNLIKIVLRLKEICKARQCIKVSFDRMDPH